MLTNVTLNAHHCPAAEERMFSMSITAQLGQQTVQQLPLCRANKHFCKSICYDHLFLMLFSDPQIPYPFRREIRSNLKQELKLWNVLRGVVWLCTACVRSQAQKLQQLLHIIHSNPHRPKARIQQGSTFMFMFLSFTYHYAENVPA